MVINSRIFAVSVASVALCIGSVHVDAQTSLQTQSLDDFQRLLSPDQSASNLLQVVPADMLEASKGDCLESTAFQKALPNLAPGVLRPLPCAPTTPIERFVMWNQIALDTTAIDHSPLPPGSQSKRFLQHLGPHRSSRAMAIVHLAIFEAINEVTRFRSDGKTEYRYASYTNRVPPVTHTVSLDLAITYSAGESLKALYEGQAEQIQNMIDLDEAAITAAANANPDQSSNPFFLVEAKKVGQSAAKALLSLREKDGSSHLEPEIGQANFILDNEPGHWRPDPISQIVTALGGRWSEVTPFVIPRSDRFRPPPPPDLTDDLYVEDFNEVKRLGGHGVRTETERDKEQSFIGVFWAYDGTPNLCAPPRLYNQIIRQIIRQKSIGSPKVLDYARIFALANMAMADAAISAWEAKYHYRFWRPVTGIRAAAADGVNDTVPDYTWQPYGAPASNSQRGPDFTPPFPSYPSGHAVFGGALFEVLRQFWPDDTSFEFTSDEFNGHNRPAGNGNVREWKPRTFTSFTQAEAENARSRVYLGVHWQFDADAGVAEGREVGFYAFNNALQCLNKDSGLPEACPIRTGIPDEPQPVAESTPRAQ